MRSRTLPPPALPESLSVHAQWLAGEGAGSWFVLDLSRERIVHVDRFDPNGRLECSGSFDLVGNDVPNLSVPLRVTYPSHCAVVSLAQGDRVFTFVRAFQHNG